MIFAGLDLSLNHSALVYLDEDNDAPLDYRFLASEAKATALGKERATRWIRPDARSEKKPDGLDDHEIAVRRLDFISTVVNLWLDDVTPDYLCIEHYAYDMTGGHQLGEIGGVIRLDVARRGIPMRYHDPQSVKMWAALSGSADKEMVVEGVGKRWGVSFDRYATSDKNKTSVEDLCDAYTLAQMIRTEWRLREGAVTLKQLHPKEIQVINRITKAMPINLLSRDFTGLE